MLVSNGICKTDTCVEAVTVLYKGHVVQIKEDAPSEEVKLFILAARTPEAEKYIFLFFFLTSSRC